MKHVAQLSSKKKEQKTKIENLVISALRDDILQTTIYQYIFPRYMDGPFNRYIPPQPLEEKYPPKFLGRDIYHYLLILGYV